jgi:hypothetical protein
MIDRAAIVDRAGAAVATAATIAALGVVAAPATAAGTPCVSAGVLATLAPGAAVPQSIGPALATADTQSATADAYTDSIAGSGLTIQHVVIGAAGCVDSSGTPGGTSTRATTWSALGGAVGGSALHVDLVPKSAPGSGWHLRPNLDGLLVAGKPAVLPEGGTLALGTWGILDRPETIDAGAGEPLRWWKAAFEVRFVRAHAGFAPGERLLFGWVASDRAPAPPAVPVAPPPTTTTPTTTAMPVTTTATTGVPSATKRSSP